MIVKHFSKDHDSRIANMRQSISLSLRQVIDHNDPATSQPRCTSYVRAIGQPQSLSAGDSLRVVLMHRNAHYCRCRLIEHHSIAITRNRLEPPWLTTRLVGWPSTKRSVLRFLTIAGSDRVYWLATSGGQCPHFFSPKLFLPNAKGDDFATRYWYGRELCMFVGA